MILQATVIIMTIFLYQRKEYATFIIYGLALSFFSVTGIVLSIGLLAALIIYTFFFENKKESLKILVFSCGCFFELIVALFNKLIDDKTMATNISNCYLPIILIMLAIGICLS